MLTPRVIQAKVYDDAIKPGIETRPAVKLIDIRERPQKRILGKIFCRFGIAREIKCDAKCFFHISTHKYIEIVSFTLPTQFHQLLVPEFVRIGHQLLVLRIPIPYKHLDAKRRKRLTAGVA
jgi:hypothetical protein